MSLVEYERKRNFKKTREPGVKNSATRKSKSAAPIFVVQEHHASHLHYDFRLQAFGTLKSWAVPKGPSTKIGDKRLAVEVEDHPIAYARFQGKIPKGEYGGGTVKIWDHGTWVPPEDLKEKLKSGHLEFELRGEKLKGRWILQRTRKGGGLRSPWLLIKGHDDKLISAKIRQPVKIAKRGSKDPWPKDRDPQLAQLASVVPDGNDWIHEIKIDGYRSRAEVRDHEVQIWTRNKIDWTHRYPGIVKALEKLKVKNAIIDGEIMAQDAKGNSDFSSLQRSMKLGRESELIFCVFDLFYLNDVDLRERPLEERKLELKKLVEALGSPNIVFSEHWRGRGKELLKKACQDGLEGIVSKNRHSPARAGRSEEWLKIKCSQRQELVIGGFTDPQGEREAFGALLMGVYEDGKFRYVGRVGTGFDRVLLNDLLPRLKKIRAVHSPFDLDSPRDQEQIHWVKPTLVAEIEFRAWTHDRILRQASFLGLREDKKAREVKKEIALDKKPAALKKSTLPKGEFRLTHPQRIIYADPETTKLKVAQYYKSIAHWILPHVADRPLSLVRCPDRSGIGCFFQKHVDHSKMTEIHEKMAQKQKVIYLNNAEGILQLVQWGVLEFHAWECHQQIIDHPDQIVFDLDPDEAVPWKTVKDTALRLRFLLEKLGIESFVKLTGGKGLHIQFPIAPRYSWDEVKNFAKTIGQQMESESPELYTTNLLKKTRRQKIFIDYLRNGFGATAVVPYSLRAKDQPVVALPIGWDELSGIKSAADYELDRCLDRLAHEKVDPWKDYFKSKQRIKILER